MAQRATDIDDLIAYEKCSTLWHAWEPFSSTTADLSANCVRCGSQRFDFFNRFSGELESRKYELSEGYKAFLEKRRNGRKEWDIGAKRLALVKRLRSAQRKAA